MAKESNDMARLESGEGPLPAKTVVVNEALQVTQRNAYLPKGNPAGSSDTATTVLSPGEDVDHFRVQRLLGRGGMGEVHLARDMKLGRKVALKLIHRRALGTDNDAVERFLLEARMTAKFSHPNIITVYAVGEYEGVPYLALEYLRGQALRGRMNGERYTPRETARMGLAIAEALREAHRHCVLHRDLKPENVLVPPDGRLRVLDFGLARQNESSSPVSERPPLSEPAPVSERPPLSDPAPLAEDPATETQVRTTPLASDEGMVGTPRYMAPEQWAAEEPTPAVDIWALGVILYELVSGKHPYEGMDLEELCFSVYDPAPVPTMVNSATLPRLLVELIMRCLNKPHAARPTAYDVIEHLESFLRTGREPLDEGKSPFRGLRAFTEHHANTFFGREAESDRFVEQLRHQAMLTIVGLSGAGKSSLGV